MNLYLSTTFARLVRQFRRHRLRCKGKGAAVFLAAVLAVTGCSVGGKNSPAIVPNTFELEDTLRRLLPAGVGVEVPGSGQHPVAQQGQSRSVSFVVRDRAGATTVTAELFKFRPPAPKLFSDCPDPAYHPYSRCRQHAAGPGESLILNLAPLRDARPSGAQRWTAVLTKPDGSQVVISEFNSLAEAAYEISRPAPVLVVDQLLQMATSPEWARVLQSVPGPRNVHTPQRTPTLASAAQLTRTLGTLLPTGLRKADPGGSDGFGHLTVEDGNGRSLVGVNVQRWSARDRENAGKVFGGASKLPDGTLVKIRRAAPVQGGRGTVEWSVDTLRPDGLRVQALALNARAYVVPSDRAEPALGIPVLEQVALAPQWQNY